MKYAAAALSLSLALTAGFAKASDALRHALEIARWLSVVVLPDSPFGS